MSDRLECRGGVGRDWFAASVGGAERDERRGDEEDAAGNQGMAEAGSQRVGLARMDAQQMFGAGGGDDREDGEPEGATQPIDVSRERRRALLCRAERGRWRRC